MAFKPAVKQVAAAKIGGFGDTGSGKTTLMAMIAIYLSKTYHNSAPVAFQDTEKGADFVQPYFDLEGVPLLTEKTRAFTDLRDAGRRAIDAGACALIDDSLTHFWMELVKIVKGDAKRLDIKKIGEAKERWAEFTSNYDRANIHWLVAGRLGYNWDNVDIEDEDGKIKNELLRGQSKMKAEGDFNYEPDLVLELESADDPNAVDYQRLRKGKRVVKVVSHQIHTALVRKCRVRELNGQLFSWPDKAYKKGDYIKIGQCFDPYFSFLNIGGEHVAFDASRNSSGLIDTSSKNDFYRNKQLAEIALEEIKNNLTCIWTAATGKDAALKLEVINRLFGTTSWSAVEGMKLDVLQRGAQIAVAMKNAAVVNMPADRTAVLALAEEAAKFVDEKTKPAPADGPVEEEIF